MSISEINKSFEFGAKAIKVWKNDSTGQHFVKAIASDTEEDFHGERLSSKALEGLAKCINTQDPCPVGLLPSHWDAFEIGTCSAAKVIDSPDFANAKALAVDIELNLDYPEARSLYNDVEKGKSKKQLSIGGYLNPDNENPYYWEPKMRTDASGGLVQDWILVLDDVILEHIAVTRANKAANNRSGFVGAIAKSLGLEKPQEEKLNIKEGGLNMAKNNLTTDNKFWEVKNSASNNKKGEILIYGDIVNYRWYEEDVSATSLIKDIKALGDITELDIRINSGGGSVFTAAAILSYLRSHKAFKTVYIDGLAASAASVIAMAGDKVCIPSHAMMMIHNPATIAWGDSREMRKVADTLDKIRDSIVNAYQVKCHKDTQLIMDMMDEETWMTGKDAVEQGFADVVLDNVEITAYYKNDILNVNGLNFETSRFKNKSKITEIMKTIEKEGSIRMAKNGKDTKGLAAVISKAVNSFLGTEDQNHETEQKPDENTIKIENARKALTDVKGILNSLDGLDNLPEDLKNALNNFNNPVTSNVTEEQEGDNNEVTESSEEANEGNGSTEENESSENHTEVQEGDKGISENSLDQEAFKTSILDEVSKLINNVKDDNKKAFENIAASLGKVIGDVVKDQISPLNKKISTIEKAAGASKSIDGQEKPAVKEEKKSSAEDSEDGDLWSGFITAALPSELKNRKYNETEE
jgi:ATP-dependent protease ClpP protease subunit